MCVFIFILKNIYLWFNEKKKKKKGLKIKDDFIPFKY